MKFLESYKRYIWAGILGIIIGNVLDFVVSGYVDWVVYGIIAAGALVLTDLTLPYFDKLVAMITSIFAKGEEQAEDAKEAAEEVVESKPKSAKAKKAD